MSVEVGLRRRTDDGVGQRDSSMVQVSQIDEFINRWPLKVFTGRLGLTSSFPSTCSFFFTLPLSFSDLFVAAVVEVWLKNSFVKLGRKIIIYYYLVWFPQSISIYILPPFLFNCYTLTFYTIHKLHFDPRL